MPWTVQSCAHCAKPVVLHPVQPSSPVVKVPQCWLCSGGSIHCTVADATASLRAAVSQTLGISYVPIGQPIGDCRSITLLRLGCHMLPHSSTCSVELMVRLFRHLQAATWCRPLLCYLCSTLVVKVVACCFGWAGAWCPSACMLGDRPSCSAPCSCGAAPAGWESHAVCCGLRHLCTACVADSRRHSPLAHVLWVQLHARSVHGAAGACSRWTVFTLLLFQT